MNKLGLTCCFLALALGAAAQGQVTGYVFQDANQNGQRDRGEKGVTNVSVSNGIQVVQTGRFPTNIVFAEEKHPLEIPLSEFIRRQRLIARESIPHAIFAPPMPVRAVEADEAYVAGAEFEAAGGAKARQRELYVCRLGIAGSVSMTTIDPESPHVDRMFDAVMAKARFLPRPLGC